MPKGGSTEAGGPEEGPCMHGAGERAWLSPGSLALPPGYLHAVEGEAVFILRLPDHLISCFYALSIPGA